MVHALVGDALIAAMDVVSAQRRLILSSDSEIVGYRVSNGTGRSYVVRRSLPGPVANDSSNLPVDAVNTAVGVAGGPARKKFFLHDLPDDWISSTAVDPGVVGALNRVIKEYADGGFQVRFQNPAAISSPVLSIDALGVVTTVLPWAIAANQTVQFLNCKDTNRRPVRGTYVVASLGVGNTFTLAHWTGQIVGRSGTARLVAFLFGPAVYLGPKQTPLIAASRKVGRPFFQSRGRVPVRR